MNKTDMKPILKWAGGKRKLFEQIQNQMPKEDFVYVEPFLGGAAVLLMLQPKEAIVNDYNGELINLYQVVKNNLEELIIILQKHFELNTNEYYLKIRALDRNIENFQKLSSVEKAARTIYLNRMCFNGLYRINKKGFFNTPYGRKNDSSNFDYDNLMNIHYYFNNSNIQFYNKSFEEILVELPKNSFVYLDPPYIPRENMNNFVSYTKKEFDFQQHILLKNCCDFLTNNGIKFLQSNSCTNKTKDLYKYYNILDIDYKHSINSYSAKETKVQEVFIKNY